MSPADRFDAESGFRVAIPDTTLEARQNLITSYGLTTPTEAFDSFAAELGRKADAPYAMVNVMGPYQHFLGLYCAGGEGRPHVDRTMQLDYGWCPNLLTRKVALVLPDVFMAPRFAHNPVTNKLGIRSYAGVPLIDDATGITFGSVCFIDNQVRPDDSGEQSKDLVTEIGQAVMDHIRSVYITTQ